MNRVFVAVEDMLRYKVEAFTNGDIAKAAEVLAVPTAIYVRDKMMLARDRCSLIRILETYRQNLVCVGYARTTLKVHKVRAMSANRVQAHVTWRNLDGDGQEINAVEAVYFCEPTPKGCLQIQIVELRSELAEHLIKGLPLE